MATIKLDKNIVDFIRRLRSDRNFGNGTCQGVVGEAIRLFCGKHEACFSCEFHKDQLAGLETGRQRMALDDCKAGKVAQSAGEWVLCKPEDLALIRMIARGYRRTAKQVVEQAVLEHLTRPPNCASCPFYAEMTGKYA